MMKLLLLLLTCLIHSTHSIKCYQMFRDGSNGTCSGDLCVVRFRSSSILAQGCTFSGYYGSLREYCVRQGDVNECYCSANEMCNVISVSTSSKLISPVTHQCFGGTTNQCVGSTCSYSFGTGERYYCENTTESVIWRANADSYISGDVSLNDPTSGGNLPVVINGTAKYAHGSCYTENCWTAAYTAKVKSMMTKNVSTWCYVGTNERACLADYCYITRVRMNETMDSFTRGCYIEDGPLVSRSNMLSGAGIDHYIDTTTVHCMEDNCNENFDRAWTSIGKPYRDYISSSSSVSLVLVITLPSLLH